MTYSRLVLPVPNSPKESIRLSAVQVADLDKALFDQDARVTALEALAADLLARVIVLETP